MSFIFPFLIAFVAFVISVKKRGFRKSLGWHFAYCFIGFDIGYIFYHIMTFFTGYNVGLFGAGNVYGFKAWELDLFSGLLLTPLAIIGTIYIFVFFISKRR